MRPNPLNELEQFYDACRTAPVPALEVPSPKSWLNTIRFSCAGLGTGVAVAIALVLLVPAPDGQRGRKDATSISNIQMAGVKSPPAPMPRASRRGPANA